MHLRERLPAGLVEDADEVDDRRGALREARETGCIADVGLDDIDGRQQEQVLRVVATARRNDDAPVVADEPADEVAADEAGAAHDEDRPAGHHRGPPVPQLPVAASVAAAPLPRGGTVPRRVASGTYG